MASEGQAPEVMTWVHRFAAMGIGGVASLFALGFSPPDTHREGLVRFASGCVFAFSCTGFILSLLHIPITIDSVLACGLACGSVGWWIMGGMVDAAKNGTILAWFGRWIQGGSKPSGGA